MKATLENVQKVLEKNYDIVEVKERLGGLSNENYLVKLDAYDYVVRVPGEGMTELGTTTVISEMLNAKKLVKANPATFVPLRVIKDSGLQIKIQHFVPSFTMDAETIKNYLIETSEILADMHNDTEQLVTHFNLNATLNRYVTAFVVRQQHSNISLNSDFCKGIDLCRNVDSYFKSRRIQKVASHNDPLPENWLLTPKGDILLIDYEYAGNNYYAFDLAAFSIEAGLSESEERAFVSYYISKSDTLRRTSGPISMTEVLEHIEVMKFYQDVLWGIWGYVKGINLETGARDEEMIEYGNSRMTRALDKLDRLTKILS